MPSHQVEMILEETRAQYNDFLTYCITREEAFGPLALTFLRELGFDKPGLTTEEQFILHTANAETFAAEPKHLSQKLNCPEKAHDPLAKTRFWKPAMARQFRQDIQRTNAELELCNQVMRVPRAHDLQGRRLIVETNAPNHFLDLAATRDRMLSPPIPRPAGSHTARQIGAPPKNSNRIRG